MSEPIPAAPNADSASPAPRETLFPAGFGLASLPRVLALVALAAALFLAWREFWFMTDDAFITFRYIDHHRRGWGYSWNPPPFAPVEGYSNFLWMVLLHAIWTVTGAAPPASANVVSLVLSFGSLALAFVMVWRMPLPPRWAPLRFWLAVLVLTYVVSNRTFVTWTSSGLETALFGFCITLWVLGVLEVGRGGGWRWLLVASAGAATSALTRPDGVLLVLATLPLGLHHAWRSGGLRRLTSLRPTLVGLLPLLTIPIHLVWRRAYYGMWVPNTYFAKQVSDWPDAGVRYTECFILEYALWAWLLVAAALLVIHLVRVERDGLPPHRLLSRLPVALVIGAFVAHVGYYTLSVGGDHFEYRVFAYLFIPIGVSLARLVVSLPVSPAIGIAVFLATTAVALPIPWIHYARSRGLNTRGETFKLTIPVADAFPPGPLREYARNFDALQRWMQQRHVGTRHQEHKIFFRHQVAIFPSRQEGEKYTWANQRPLFSMTTVGIPGWVFPEVAIIDYFGLNDKVVARTPVTSVPPVRMMAHERTPPPGYIECFEPNFALDGARILPLAPRKTPLTDQVIHDCEWRFSRP